MLNSLDVLEKQLSRTEHHLLYHLILELQENNRLLRAQGNGNKQDDTYVSDDHKEATQEDLDSLKRPELMKRMAKLIDKPQGWNKWETEDMRKHLKGAS